MMKGSLRQVLVLLSCAIGSFYFAYHAYAGRQGLEVRWRLTSELHDTELRLSNLEVLRATLERDIALLQADQLDPDMLDEAARQVGFAHPNDLIVLQR